jgi:hypothetical protein
MINTFRHGSWIVTLPLGVIAAAYIMGVYLPNHRVIGELRRDAAEKQDFIDEAAQTNTAIGSGKRTLEKTLAYTTAREQLAPHEKEMSLLYGRIHEAARAAGASPSRFDPQAVAAFDTFRRTKVVVGCSGSFLQIYEFLRRLEGMPAAIWVDSVRIDKKGDSGGEIGCEVDLAIFADNSESSGYAKHMD